MTEFNQEKFESKAKRLVVECLDYGVNEKDVFIVWFSKVGANAKAMICDMDDHCFEVTYFGEDGEYIIKTYRLTGWDDFNEEEL